MANNPVQNINQFSMTALCGMLDLRFNTDVIDCEIDSSSAGSLIPGQPLVQVNSVNGVPLVKESAANTDAIFGFIVYDIKSRSYSAGDRVSVAAFQGNFMYMVANAAFAAGASLMIVQSLTNPQVATATTGHVIIGTALDKATAAGQLVRVRINLPGATA